MISGLQTTLKSIDQNIESSKYIKTKNKRKNN